MVFRKLRKKLKKNRKSKRRSIDLKSKKTH